MIYHYSIPLGTTFAPGDMLVSLSQQHISGAYLIFQTDGNLVLYRRPQDTANYAAIWDSRTNGSGADKAELQTDGNLVVYNGTHAVWESQTWRRPFPRSGKMNLYETRVNNQIRAWLALIHYGGDLVWEAGEPTPWFPNLRKKEMRITSEMETFAKDCGQKIYHSHYVYSEGGDAPVSLAEVCFSNSIPSVGQLVEDQHGNVFKVTSVHHKPFIWDGVGNNHSEMHFPSVVCAAYDVKRIPEKVRVELEQPPNIDQISSRPADDALPN